MAGRGQWRRTARRRRGRSSKDEHTHTVVVVLMITKDDEVFNLLDFLHVVEL